MHADKVEGPGEGSAIEERVRTRWLMAGVTHVPAGKGISLVNRKLKVLLGNMPDRRWQRC